MLDKIKQWFEHHFATQAAQTEKILQQLDQWEPDKASPENLSKQLCRELLKLKDFSALQDLDGNPYANTEQDRKNYCAVASTIYLSKPFQDIIKLIQYEQMRFTVLESQNSVQDIMARGTINGAALIEERFEALHAEHLKNSKPEPIPEGTEKFDLIAN